jgi:hypothetical protein
MHSCCDVRSWSAHLNLEVCFVGRGSFRYSYFYFIFNFYVYSIFNWYVAVYGLPLFMLWLSSMFVHSGALTPRRSTAQWQGRRISCVRTWTLGSFPICVCLCQCFCVIWILLCLVYISRWDDGQSMLITQSITKANNIRLLWRWSDSFPKWPTNV